MNNKDLAEMMADAAYYAVRPWCNVDEVDWEALIKSFELYLNDGKEENINKIDMDFKNVCPDCNGVGVIFTGDTKGTNPTYIVCNCHLKRFQEKLHKDS